MSKFQLNQLLDGIKHRDDRILNHVYKEFYPKVLGYIISKGGNDHDAKDIFQESIIVIFKLLNANRLEIETDFGSYLIGIVRRLWLKHLRSESIHDKYVNQTVPEISEDHPSDVELENEVELQLIRTYIGKLGEDCRKILLWSAEGITNDEIAERMRYKSEKTVRTKKYKCKLALLEMIKKDPKYKNRH